MKYYLTTDVHLFLEDFHNDGLTPEETKEILEGIVDPGSSRAARLGVRPSGINHNWTITTMLIDHRQIEYLIGYIIHDMRLALSKKKCELPFTYGWNGRRYADRRLEDFYYSP